MVRIRYSVSSSGFAFFFPKIGFPRDHRSMGTSKKHFTTIQFTYFYLPGGYKLQIRKEL